MNNDLGKSVFKTRKTIKLGTGLKTATNFRNAVKSAVMMVDPWANSLLISPNFKACAHEIEVELVLASLDELGFKDGAKCKNICARAKEFGLDLCPPEVGPQLRLQYVDQPRYEWLVIMMKPIADLGGNLSMFNVGHDGNTRWLNASCGGPDYVWLCGYRYVFLQVSKNH